MWKDLYLQHNCSLIILVNISDNKVHISVGTFCHYAVTNLRCLQLKLCLKYQNCLNNVYSMLICIVHLRSVIEPCFFGRISIKMSSGAVHDTKKDCALCSWRFFLFFFPLKQKENKEKYKEFLVGIEWLIFLWINKPTYSWIQKGT